MGNCCGGTFAGAPRLEGDGSTKAHTVSGMPPPHKMMTPDENERRRQARIAAEERARKNAVRGTQRYTYVCRILFFRFPNSLARRIHSLLSSQFSDHSCKPTFFFI